MIAKLLFLKITRLFAGRRGGQSHYFCPRKPSRTFWKHARWNRQVWTDSSLHRWPEAALSSVPLLKSLTAHPEGQVATFDS